MTLIEDPSRRLTVQDFVDDPHAAKYLGELERRGPAFEHLLLVLNDPATERLLEHESTQDHAALRAIVTIIDSHPELAAAVGGQAGRRYRQAIGVAVRLKMERLGWTTSGRKGPVDSPNFTRAEKYVPAASPGNRRAAALAALDRVAEIGTEQERRQTGDELMAALRATRAEQGRPF